MIKKYIIKRFTNKLQHMISKDNKTLSINDFRDDFSPDAIYFILRYLKQSNVYTVKDAKEFLPDIVQFFDDEELDHIDDIIDNAPDDYLININLGQFDFFTSSYLYEHLLKGNQLV